MSLINEALKRARVEAARRDATARGVPPAALPVYVPRRRRPWLAPVAGFAAGLVAVAMATGAFWLVRRPAMPPSGTAATAGEVADSLAQAVAVRALPSPAAPPIEAPSPAAPRPEASTIASRPARPAAAPPIAARPVIAESAVAESAVAEPAAVAPAPVAPSLSPRRLPPAGDDGIRTYLRQATPAGERVKVDFIVWSKSQPFAQINGELLSSGQSVDGYTLLEVERERVQLEGGGERFWLRVK